MVMDLPVQYLFHLVCCYKPDCYHPFCQTGSWKELPKWFTGGPYVSYLPIPIPDPARPWGSTNCSQCDGVCYGHFMEPEIAMSPLQTMLKPPSTVIREAFESKKDFPSESDIQKIAKAVLLSPDEVNMWCEHLHTVRENRKRGALKAAETRRRKRVAKQATCSGVTPKQTPASVVTSNQSTDDRAYFCGVCHEQYVQFTDEEEHWIGCEVCNSWYHFVCVGIATVIPDRYICVDCQDV